MPKPLIENLPYPDLSGIAVNYHTARIIMPAYAQSDGELTAILQYTFHSLNFRSRSLYSLAELTEDIAIAEMRHLELLGDALLRLGVSPVFSRRPPEKCDFFSTSFVDYSTIPAAALSADIAAESQAIKTYECMLDKLDDPTVSALISRIILDERLHLERLKSAYRDLLNAPDTYRSPV